MTTTEGRINWGGLLGAIAVTIVFTLVDRPIAADIGPAGAHFELGSSNVNIVELAVALVAAAIVCLVIVTVMDHFRTIWEADGKENEGL